MPEAVNGNAVITIDDHYLTAHVVVNEPQFGGRPYTYEMLCDELVMRGVRYNVFHDDLKQIFEKKENMTLFCISHNYHYEIENVLRLFLPFQKKAFQVEYSSKHRI